MAWPVFQPIISDDVMVVTEELRETVAVEDTFNLVGAPASAFLSDADGSVDSLGGGGCRRGGTPSRFC